MKIIKDKENLYFQTSKIKNLGFVPTMGGLHNGHKYLINKAKKSSNKVLVSIYVNPKQFNSKKDFNNYPRTISKDLRLLKKLNVNFVYLPNSKEIFSFKPKYKVYKDKFSKKLCGKYRGRHFDGVLNVVNRLLELTRPKKIYLGMKDFQQLILIKKHIFKNKISTVVIPCKIIREKNGVACSSRNQNLNYLEKKLASYVYFLIRKKKEIMKKKGIINLELNKINKIIKKIGIKKIDYLECINIKTLIKPKSKKDKFKIFIAYYIGSTRLIDNI